MPWNYERTNFDRNLAVVIGIDHYKNDSIHDLKTPVSDAKAIAHLLQNQYGYQPQNIISLLDEDATLIGLQTLLNDTLLKQFKPTDADRLIFYFAGHGIPRNSDDGPAGYLVPQDADGQNQDSFLAMTDLCEALKKLECHHLLVILDCCFAGMFNWAGHRKMIPILKIVYKEHYDRFIRYPAWQVITSSAQDQEALDVATLAQDKRGSIADEKQELHSPFALGLLEGLFGNQADFIPDRVITAHELYLYLEQRVSELSGEHQKPGLHSMRVEYDKGEFIFTQPDFDAKKQLQPAPILNEHNNPYRGLKAFEERDSAFFFGRQLLVDELSDRFVKSTHPLTIVVGASGSGKSSLVKAGLLPNLRDSQQKGCYILNPMQPGKSPFTQLAKTLIPVVNPNLLTQLTQVSFLNQRLAEIVANQRVQSSNSTSDQMKKLAQSWDFAQPETQLSLVADYWDQLQSLCDQPQEKKQLDHLYRAIQETLKPLIQELQQNPQSLTSIIKKWSQVNPSTQLLLVIDQFEELITMSPQITATEEQQKWYRFLSLFRIALEQNSKSFHLVVTLRSDFEPRFHNSPLTPYWQNGRFPIRIMTSDELRDAIEKPACKQALHFEPSELVGRLIDELAQTPGALPLLSFTLSELYIKLAQRWREDPNCCDRALRMQDYEELGGVNGALTRRATEEYDNLIKDFGQVSGEAHQMTLRRLMLRMVTIEGGEIARRRIPDSELIYTDLQENQRVAEVIERLVNARLIVKSQELGESSVEPAHDYLVRGWDLLQEWLKQEQSNLVLQKSLISNVSDWDKAAKTAKQGFKNSEVVRLLWDDDPRLPQVKAQLKLDPYWLNQEETTFVNDSLKRKQNKLIRLMIILFSVNLIILGFAALALFNQNQAKKQRFQALIQSSEAFLSSKQPLKALENAIQAGESVKNGKNLMTILKPNSVFMPGHELEMQAINSLQKIGYKITQLNRWQAHAAPITTVSFDPKNDHQIISASEDETIKIWNQDRSQPLKQTLKVPDRQVSSLSLSPDGYTLISGSLGGKIRLWSKDSTGQFKTKPDRTFDPKKHTGNILAVAFNPTGTLIASAGVDEKVSLWKKDGTWLGYLGTQQNQHQDAIYSVSFSPNKSELVTAARDGIKLWKIDGTSIKYVKYFDQEKTIVYGIAYSPNGSYIASGHGDGKIKLWKSDGTLIKELTGHIDGVRGVSFSPDSSKIVSAGQDRTVKLWDVEKEALITTFEGHGGDVRSVSFNSDSSIIASAGADNTIQLWKPEPILKNQVFSEHTDVVYAVDFSDDGLWLATASADKTIKVWRRNNQGIYEQNSPLLTGHKKRIYTLAFSPDNSTIASADEDGKIILWQLDQTGHFSKAKVPQPKNIGYQIRGIAFNSDGSEMASTSSDKKVRIWKKPDNGSYEIVQTLSTADAENSSAYGSKVTFSPDNQLLAISHENGTVKLWKKDIDGKFKQKAFDILSGHSTRINQVAFGSDSSILASASSDGTIRVWKRNSQGKYQSKTFTGHNGAVYGLAFHPNGKMIASAGQDNTVKLWDLESSQPITLSEHTNRVFGVAFSPDGKTLASVGWDQKLILWNLDFLNLDQLLKESCEWARPYLQNSNFVDKSQPKICLETKK